MKKPERDLAYWLSLAAALALLVCGAVAARTWIYALSILPIAILDGLSRRFAWNWCPAALFLVYIALAAGGLFLGFPPALMIAGAAATLFHWELSEPLAGASRADEIPQAGLFYRQRLRYLGISTATGLFLAELGLVLRVDLPFAGAILAAVVLLFCIYRLFLLRPKKP